MPREEILEAHKHSSGHRKDVIESVCCGCFCCLRIYSPAAIKEWVDDGECAICPMCDIDSVIGSKSGYPITPEFLGEMCDYWLSTDE